MEPDQTVCPLCLKQAKGTALGPLDQILRYECVRCGRFQITDEAVDCLQEAQMGKDLFKISAYTRERSLSKRPLVTIVSESRHLGNIVGAAIEFQSIIAQFPDTISGRLSSGPSQYSCDLTVPRGKIPDRFGERLSGFLSRES